MQKGFSCSYAIKRLLYPALLNTGFLAAQFAQVEDTCTANKAATVQYDFFNKR